MAYEATPLGPEPGLIPPKRRKKIKFGFGELAVSAPDAAESTAGVVVEAERPKLDDMLKGIMRKRETTGEPAGAEAETTKLPPKAEEAPKAAGAQELSDDMVIELAAFEPEEAKEVASRLVDGRREQAAEVGAPPEVVEFYDATDARLSADETIDQAASGAVEDTIGEAADEVTPGMLQQEVAAQQAGTAEHPQGDSGEDEEVPDYATADAQTAPGNMFAFGRPPAERRTARGPSEQPEFVVEQRGNPALAGVLGLVFGYLIGRRQGRKLTERELQPVQAALEKKVREQDAVLTLREAQVRRYVRERDAADRRTNPAAAEQTKAPHIESLAQQPARAERPAPSVERLHINDVLKISESITVGETTIRRVYEANLVSERGLRRIVREHLNGGDVRRVLSEEMIIKEIGHELDPMLRDRSPEPPASSATTVSQAAADTASPVVPGGAEANEAERAIQSPYSAAHEAHQNRAAPYALVIANIVALVVLGIVLAALLVTWLTR